MSIRTELIKYSYRIVLAGITGFLLFQVLFRLLGLEGVPDPLSALLSGSFLYGIMFMATDTGRWIYGAMIGILTSLIRTFSAWPEGITFAILLANMFAPLINNSPVYIHCIGYLPGY